MMAQNRYTTLLVASRSVMNHFGVLSSSPSKVIRSKFMRASLGMGLDGEVRDDAVEGSRIVASRGVAGLPTVY